VVGLRVFCTCDQRIAQLLGRISFGEPSSKIRALLPFGQYPRLTAVYLVWRERWFNCRCLRSPKKHLIAVWILRCISRLTSFVGVITGQAGQMNRHIRHFGLLCPFHSRFRRHQSTTTAALKVTEDIRLNLEDGQATVLVMLDFTQAFDMIAHDLMVCKMRASQRYSDGATALLGSYLSDQTQCVRSEWFYGQGH
jgi:hypothetical protein